MNGYFGPSQPSPISTSKPTQLHSGLPFSVPSQIITPACGALSLAYLYASKVPLCGYFQRIPFGFDPERIENSHFFSSKSSLDFVSEFGHLFAQSTSAALLHARAFIAFLAHICTITIANVFETIRSTF